MDRKCVATSHAVVGRFLGHINRDVDVPRGSAILAKSTLFNSSGFGFVHARLNFKPAARC